MARTLFIGQHFVQMFGEWKEITLSTTPPRCKFNYSESFVTFEGWSNGDGTFDFRYSPRRAGKTYFAKQYHEKVKTIFDELTEQNKPIGSYVWKENLR